MSDLPLVLALHAQDIAAIAVVLLVWAGLRRLGRGRRGIGSASRRGAQGGAPQAPEDGR